MFTYDKPIETEKEDFLSRKGFSQHLGESLLNWKEEESLVIAIYGEWGSGKSSVINLAKEFIKKTDESDKPIIIEFNPWRFSEQANLSKHFFNEIAKELEIRQDNGTFKKLAKEIKIYASLLNFMPDKCLVVNSVSKTVLLFGLLGITASQIIQLLNVPYDLLRYILFIGGFSFIAFEILKDFFIKLSALFNDVVDYNKKSVLDAKKDITNELIKKKIKLIVVIDDIDRLNQSEIKQIFRLIRINADFPHTIYLLAFDRNIIEKNLEEQVGISGRDYLNKIVQVDFDIPFAKPAGISAFLLKELDRVLGVLPESAQKFFDQDDHYWADVYNSGFKKLFKNIRDVKRYANSLEFNILQMQQGEVMEVNPIDFIAIEAIRVFAPDFYFFMKSRKSLFTSTDRESIKMHKNIMKVEIEEALNKLHEDTKESIQDLVTTLFPQVIDIISDGHSAHGHEWQSIWSRNSRVCATTNFDSYFTLIPGGDEGELSQYEIENILNKTNSSDEFETILREYIGKNKIRQVLQRMQDYTEDQIFIPQSNTKNIVLALFNISDDLPEEKIGIFDSGADMDVMRIIYQILKRDINKNNNFEILKETIPLSKGLYGPVQEISLESPKKDEGRDSREFIVPEDKIEELQKLCSEKINLWQDKLLEQKELIYIMYRWEEWDQEQKWKGFVDDILDDDNKLVAFVDKFVTETMSQTIGTNANTVRTKKFNYKYLENFVKLDYIKTRFEKVKIENNDLYGRNKEIIDCYLGNYDRKYKEI